MKLRSYKYRIYPTVEQAEKLAKAFGCARWTWNFALALRDKTYKETQKGISDYNLINDIAAKKTEPETAWLSDAPSQALQQTLIHQGRAFTAFFKKRGQYPRFKSKHDKQSLSLPQGVKVNFSENEIVLPKVREVKAVLHRRFEGVIKTCAVSKTPTGKYFVSILVEEAGEEVAIVPAVEETCIGIDLGIREFAVLSDGSRFERPKFISKKLKKLRREQRKLSRRKKESNRRRKQKESVSRLHEKVANTRLDFHHQLTSRLVKNQDYGSFAMEDLGIQGMMKSNPRWMAREIADAGWFQFKTLLKYKAQRAGKEVLEVGRFTASSKTCACGNKYNKLARGDKEWICPKCGQHHNRDLNAAVNIRKFAFIERATVKYESKNLTWKVSKVGRESPEPQPGESLVATRMENRDSDSVNCEKYLFTPGETPVE